MKPPANSSELVAALLEDDFDPKDYAYNALPSALDSAVDEVRARVAKELERAMKRKPTEHFTLQDFMHDKAIEVAGEVACERGLSEDPFFNELISRVLKEYT